MKEIKNFVVFNSQVKHGQMNAGKKYYPGLENNVAERKRIANENKQNLAAEVGFNLDHLFMLEADDEKHIYVPGTSYILTPEDVANYDVLFDYSIWADTVKLTRKTPGVIIGYNVADGANVIAMNMNTLEATSTFCSGPDINQMVPFTIASTLGGNPEDIMVDISPFAYTIPFDQERTWTSNSEAWKGCLSETNGIIYIDQKKALLSQLEASGIKKENIYVRENSLQNPNYYSAQRAYFSDDSSQDGRFMHGVMFEREGEEKEYNQPYIKKYPVKG